MKLDPNTFGSTPAALYLVDRLNELDDPRVARAIGRKITQTREFCKELEASQTAGHLSTKNLAAIVGGSTRAL